MFNQHFGQYLLNKKLITPQQLIEVMGYERSVGVKLGVLAMDAGLMSGAQVEAVHHMQRIQDKRFGELSVEQGYLNYGQLEDLLQNQHSRHLGLSQVIIDKEYLTLEQLETVLISYKKDSQLSKIESPVIEEMNFDQTCAGLVDFTAAGPQEKIYHDYIGLLQRNIVRFLDADPVMGKNEPIGHFLSKWLIQQRITGEINLFTGLAMDDATLLEMACRYSGESLTEIDELTKDSVAEFLNMVNGIFCVNASNRGVELDLQLQEIVQTHMPTLKTGYRIPITLSFGTIDVIVAVG